MSDAWQMLITRSFPKENKLASVILFLTENTKATFLVYPLLIEELHNAAHPTLI